MNMFMDPTYMESFFPFPPIENDGMSTHSGGSIAAQGQGTGQGQGQGHQPSPQSMGFFGHQSQTLSQNPPQQPGQQGPPWW